MSQSYTFTYTFTDPSGLADTITLTTSTVAADFGYGPSYAVTAISGTVDGQAVTGELGNAGAVQTSTSSNGYYTTYDNAIFLGSGGYGGNVAGIDVYGLEFSAGGIEYNLFDEQNGTLQLFPLGSVPSTPTQTVTNITTDAPCFCAGTLIRTPDGEVAVETLKMGDRVLTLEGQAVAVRWIGLRHIARRFGDPMRVLPVRIQAGALGENSPVRDLRVSPDHAMFLGGVLVQAGALVNGGNITRERNMPEIFTYFHVEVAEHCLIWAEGAATETFVDNVDRMGFDNWAEFEALYGHEAPIAELPYPRAKSARQVPLALRRFLAGRDVALRA